MMNIVERIVITNNGAEVKVSMFNSNNKVIDSETMRISMNLIDNDYNKDYETIADLCYMTVEELTREYEVESTKIQRKGLKCGADYILTYIEFKRKDVFDLLLQDIQEGIIDFDDDEDYEEYYYDDEPEVTEEMMNNAIEHIYYMDRVLGENCEILESDWRNENYTTYVTEDEKYRYTLTESDIARVAIAMKYSDKENVYETICPIVEEILIEQFAKMRKEDMAKKVISLSEYRNRR